MFKGWDDPEAEEKFGELMGILSATLNLRGENNVPPSKDVSASIHVEIPETATLVLNEKEWFMRLGKIDRIIEIGPEVEPPKGSATAVSGSSQIFFHNIKDLIDVDEEIRRVEKQLREAGQTIEGLDKKLANPSFVERAPAEVVEKDRGRLAEVQDREAKLRAHLARLQELKG